MNIKIITFKKIYFTFTSRLIKCRVIVFSTILEVSIKSEAEQEIIKNSTTSKSMCNKLDRVLFYGGFFS